MKRQAGFTLLEVLGALALLALLLTGIHAGMHSAAQGVRAGSAAIERMDAIGSVQRFLRRELAQAMPLPLGRAVDGRPIVFVGSARELRYVAPLPGYLGALGPQLQVLRLVDDGHGMQRLELRLALLPPDGQPPQPLGTPQVLLDGLRGGNFAYRGRDAAGNELPWRDRWNDGRNLPQLVRVQLQTGGGIGWPLLEMPLRVDGVGAARASLRSTATGALR